MLEHVLPFVNPNNPTSPFQDYQGSMTNCPSPYVKPNPTQKAQIPTKTLAKPKSDLIQAGAARSVAHPLLVLRGS